MGRGYEYFEHTADVGALVRGVTLPRLFENAAAAMGDLICARRTVRPRRTRRVEAQGSGLEDLLVRFLTELLVLHETAGLVFSSVQVGRVDRTRFRVRALVRGEPIDRTRHALLREVKAITYHQIRIVRGRSAWRVRLIFDI